MNRLISLGRSIRVGGAEGATMVEYGLMIALIAIVCFLAVTLIGQNLNDSFSDPTLVDALS